MSGITITRPMWKVRNPRMLIVTIAKAHAIIVTGFSPARRRWPASP